MRTELVISAETCRIDRAWQGIGLSELSKARIRDTAVVGSILERVRVQDRLEGGGCLLPHEGVRDVLDRGRLRLNQTQPFVGHKEERFVLAVIDTRAPYRAAERASKVILMQRGEGLSVVIVEPVVRIEYAISEVVERASMQGVSS